MSVCEEHHRMSSDVADIKTDVALVKKDVAYILKDLQDIICKFSNHVYEAEKPGGRHDQLNTLSNSLYEIKIQRQHDLIMGRWFMLGAGVLGGGIVSGIVNISALIQHFLK